MADGIRIQDAAVEISPEGLEALLNQRGAEVTVTKLDLSVSPEALNTLLAGLAPQGVVAPTAECADGRLRVTAEKEGKPMALDLRVGGVRIELTAGGLRLTAE
ncbi:MAG: hypothetical protein K0Q72_5251 [Armatimonadetes bacterium]|jgi:hypothetical protein|nr:hypothetical protein [Armatimonadota bacterium]